MKLNKLLSIFILLFVALFLSPKAHAAYLYLEPSQKTVQPGTEFDIELKINSEGEMPTTSDSLIQFDKNNLTFVDVIEIPEAEAAFPEIISRVTDDKIYVGAYIRLGSDPKAVDKTIALLRFKGLNEAQTYVNFLCTEGDTTDSNISLKKNRAVTDVIDCSSTVNGTYIISSSGTVPPTPTPVAPTPIGGSQITPTQVPTGAPTLAPTATSIPTPTPSATPTLQPTILPETGVFETTGIVILIGVSLTIVSLLVKFYIT